MTPVMTLTEGRCCGDDQMNAGGTGELGNALDRLFDILAGGKHQVSQLVDDDDDARHFLQLFFRVAANVFVVAGQVANAYGLQSGNSAHPSCRR